MSDADPADPIWHPVFSFAPRSFSGEISDNGFPDWGAVTKVLSSRSLQVSYRDGRRIACQYTHGAPVLQFVNSMAAFAHAGVWLIGATVGVREERGRPVYFVRRVALFVNSGAYADERSRMGVVHGDFALLGVLSGEFAHSVEMPGEFEHTARLIVPAPLPLGNSSELSALSGVPWHRLQRHQHASVAAMRRVESMIGEGSLAMEFQDTVEVGQSGWGAARQGDMQPPRLAQLRAGTAPRRVPIRGAILADGEGTGKTRTAAAFISADSKSSRAFAHTRSARGGTMVLVPGAIELESWLTELRLDPGLDVVHMSTMRDFNRLTRERILSADVVLVTSGLFANAKYIQTLRDRAKDVLRLQSPPARDVVRNAPATAMLVEALDRNPGGAKNLPLLEVVEWRRVVVDELAACFSSPGALAVARCLRCACFWGVEAAERLRAAGAFGICKGLVADVDSSHRWSMTSDMAFVRSAVVCHADPFALSGPVRRAHPVRLTDEEAGLYAAVPDIHPTGSRVLVCSGHRSAVAGARKVVCTISEASRLVRDATVQRVRVANRRLHTCTQSQLTCEGRVAQLQLEIQARPDDPEIGDRLRTMAQVAALHTRTAAALGREVSRAQAIMDFTCQRFGLAPELGGAEPPPPPQAGSPKFDEAAEPDCPVCFAEFGGAASRVLLNCGHFLCRACVSSIGGRGASRCPVCRDPGLMGVEIVPRCDNVTRYGSKIVALMAATENSIHAGDGVVIFAQWAALASRIHACLTEQGLASVLLQGSATVRAKAARAYRSGTSRVIVVSDDVGLHGADLRARPVRLLIAHPPVGSAEAVRAMQRRIVGRLVCVDRVPEVLLFFAAGTVEEDLVGAEQS